MRHDREYDPWDDDVWLAAWGAEMSARMCADGDHYVVDGVCTACGEEQK